MPADLPATTLAGRYRIERELGAGGMATVYLARDLKHDRRVAVKVLSPELAATVGAERFLREIRITAGLQHTNILTLIDSGEWEDLLYYVMPFVDGESLRTHIARAGGALPTAAAVLVLREMLDALAHAHRHGLVHRDIKPENVMLAERHALVLDFGVAKAVQVARADDARRTRAEAGGAPSIDALTTVGTSLGTPAYMAPEQAVGDTDVDHRADLYSVGVVAYELFTGHPPFRGRPNEVLAAHVTAAPPPLAELAPSLPPALARLVMQCLEKERERRPQSAEQMIEAIDAIMAPTVSRGPWTRLTSRLGTRGATVTVGAAALLVLVSATLLLVRARDAAWVRDTAVPELGRLIDASQPESALVVAERALAIAPGDPRVNELLPSFARTTTVVSTPAGARLAWTTYDDSTGWRDGGVAPATLRLPRSPLRMRLELAGHRPLMLMVPGADTMRVALDPLDAPDPGMVLVRGGETFVQMPGLSNLEPLVIGDFRIDRHEVTNREYKAFVEAGGYTKPEYWKTPIVRNGRTLPFAEAMRLFVDRTGRPGPAVWEAGDHAAGAAELPVGGVSWHEASAYATWAGKELPDIYQWNRAARTGTIATVVRGSNYGQRGPRAASTFLGLNPYGTFDMAGNMREWCLNAFGAQRFILGGGWSDQSYAFVDAYAQDPLDRAIINGFRLVKRVGVDSSAALATAPITREFRDYSRERPVSDALYGALTGMFAYDRTPLDVRAESRDTSAADWVVEKVSIASAYGRERMPVYLWVPRRGARPMQALVVYPGSNAFFEERMGRIESYNLDAVLKTGRMVVWPVYASQYEREHTLASDAPNPSATYRDHIAMWVKDVRRTLDYLETRDDVDSTRIAYFGYSFGGRFSPIALANEPRFRTAVLAVAGLKMETTRPESDPLNYLPRVRMPVLMLNGKYDHYFPLETSQKPFFAMLGTPPADKRHVVYEGGHTVPRTVFIAEMLQWLDRYLGPTGR